MRRSPSYPKLLFPSTATILILVASVGGYLLGSSNSSHPEHEMQRAITSILVQETLSLREEASEKRAQVDSDLRKARTVEAEIEALYSEATTQRTVNSALEEARAQLAKEPKASISEGRLSQLLDSLRDLETRNLDPRADPASLAHIESALQSAASLLREERASLPENEVSSLEETIEHLQELVRSLGDEIRRPTSTAP